jgi:hypothetical protein
VAAQELVKMKQLFKSHRFLTLAALLLTACQQQSSIVSGDAKSTAYYEAHVEEAKATAEKCMAFEANILSAMAPSKQKEWQETADGISCTNARQVAQVELIKANQKRMSDAAAKYR